MTGRILVVAPDFPYPPNHGGRVDMWTRLKLLKELGFAVDLIASVKEAPLAEEEGVVRELVDRLVIVMRGGAFQGLLGITPHQVANRGAFRHHKFEDSYDAVLLEGPACGTVLQNPTLKSKNVILRVHNDESLYFRKLASSTKHPLKKFYYFVESLRLALYERAMSKTLNHFLFISKEECKKFLSNFSRKNAIFLPPATPNIVRQEKKNGTKRVLFIGSLFMPNNRDGLEWYMRDVHPLLRKIDGYQFVVVGNPKGTSLDWLTKGPYGDEIELHVSPPVLDPFYANADVFVNPMRFGAGMKIKTIEALCHGLPMVSTSTGTEGTGLEDSIHLYQTDDSDLFAQRIAELLENRNKGEELLGHALTYIESEFNAKKKLKDFLDQVLAGVSA